MTSEKERMLSRQLYNAFKQQRIAKRKHTRSFLYHLKTSEYGDADKYSEIISQLLPNCASDIQIEPPFFCDQGQDFH